jgi:hypothetical protein
VRPIGSSGSGVASGLRLSGLALLLSLLAGWSLQAQDEPLFDITDQLPPALERTVDYVKDIKPLLRKSCYSCHGEEEQEAGLRLDVRKRALQGGDQGAVIVPGKAGQSLLMLLVAGLNEERGQMPPEGEGTPLDKDQIALLRSWIDQGAKWPDDVDAVASSSHWSFQPLKRPAVPEVKQASWPRTPLDNFILARLEREGIEPSPVADRATLIRRLSIDLLGLLPSPSQVEQFLADQRPDAYEQLVEELLRSKHYGERWARHWLDLARYADSDGYEKDRARPHAWRYRHWVINALNDDMPFDQFSTWQLAGDMLPETSIAMRVASGFHRNTLHNTEGGTDQEEDRVKKTVDRLNTFGSIWLGLTVGCAQCHTHKYDPITQREYYSLYAFFNNINEADVAAPTVDEQKQFEVAKAAFDEAQLKLTGPLQDYETNELAAAQVSWEPTALQTVLQWESLKPLLATSLHGAELAVGDDLAVLVSGANEKSDIYTVQGTITSAVLRAIRLEVLPHDSLPTKGPGRAANGNFVLTTVRLAARPAESEEEFKPLPLKGVLADFSQQEWAAALAINENPADGWAVSPQFGKRHLLVLELAEPLAAETGLELQIQLEQQYETGEAHNIGHFRLSTTSGTAPLTLDGLPPAVATGLGTPAEQRNEEQKQAITSYFRQQDSRYLELKKVVDEHAAKAPKPSATKAQSVAEGDRRQAHVHVRGDFLSPGIEVNAETVSVLPDLKPRSDDPEHRPDRLDLASWLFQAENPLTARVTANRIWYRHFGRGIVATIDDFGDQGELPSHPGLLDWLAVELQDNAWSIKQLHRLIVSSATYRQQSAYRTELIARDPDNTLLARQNRLRVEAEVVRDLALDASGLLSRRLGGPSVRPPQPTGHSSLTYANSAKWETSGGEDRYRRGLYTFFQRTSPYPMLMTFDAPDSNVCAAQRQVSNTPLQALTIWNDPVFVECAQALGRRLLAEVPASEEVAQTSARRARHAMMLCLSRPVTPGEQQIVVDCYQLQKQFLQENPEAVGKICGSLPIAEGVDQLELASWVAVGRVLLNLDEFIYRQ